MPSTTADLDLPALWKDIAGTIKAEVSPDTFNRWFKDIELVALSPTEMTLCVPNNIYQFWIESNYLSLVQSSALLALGTPRSVRFVFSESASAPARKSTHAHRAEKAPAPEPEAAPAESPEEESPVSTNGLNPRNTFESFVVGANNQFASAACLAVASAPAKTYNPLFIYGGVGLGKTHLMHAIGHAIRAKKKSKVLYISSEHFTNEFIDAIQNGTLVKFRRRYRSVDVLLIDDIHFFADKERSQEEFFHTFNALFDGHKQIVLSSDRPASEIRNLESRLVSRFEWGLTAELLPPDSETRVAILKKKEEIMRLKISNEILEFLASRIRTNVRRLEGALMRVASYVSLNEGHMPPPERLEHLLKDLLQEEARRVVTIDQIKTRVAEHFDVRLADMTSKRRPANIAFPRQVAMYFARELTKSSLCEIGDAFGGRDHGTVIHAHRLVKERIKNDEKVRQIVSYLDSQFQR
jgi:chromosomal replication initiator protein